MAFGTKFATIQIPNDAMLYYCICEIETDILKFKSNKIIIVSIDDVAPCDVYLRAVQTFDWAFRFVPDSLKEDREFCLAAVRHNGMALHFVSDPLKDDPELCLAAVQNNGCALQYVSDSLGDNLELCLVSVQEWGCIAVGSGRS